MKPRFGGAFNWETLLCRFFLNDLDPLATEVLVQPNEPLAQFAAIAAMSGRDVSTMALLPEHESKDVQQTLFHEQVHYWQLLSSPFLQSLFMCALQKTRLVVAANGGIPPAICGEPGYDGATDFVTPALRSCYVLMGRTIGKPEGIIHSMLDAAPAAFHVQFEWKYPPDNYFLPGYLLGLLYPPSTTEHSENPPSRIINVDLTSLTESHAFISECQFAGTPPPELALNDPTDDDLYKGIFEAWRRYHPHQPTYVLSRALSIVLQIAFDGGLPYPLMNFQEPEDFPVERFKRLFVKSSLAKWSELSNAAEVQAFRSELEQLCQLTPTIQVLSAAKARILRILIFSLAPYLEERAHPWCSWVEALENDNCINPLALEAVKNEFSIEQRLPLGAQVLATMYNAIELRQSDPCLFSLPAHNRELLESKFPLPLVLLRGKYCIASAAPTQGSPIPVWQGMLRDEILALTSIRPMVTARFECGFLDAGAKCWYVAEGLGCPRKGGEMSPEAAQLRHQSGLSEWCHRLSADIMLGFASFERGPDLFK